MRRLNPLLRGAAPKPLVMTVDTSVALAIFGSETWWPGLKRPTTHGLVTPPTTHYCGLIIKAILQALGATISQRKTTPLTIFFRESGIPPARTLLGK